MKPLAALLVAALGVAVLAVILDSPALILLSILGVVGVSLATFLISARTAQEGQYLVPYVAILAGALGPAALAVTAIVIGERGDAPGLVLFGVVLITSVVVGAFAVGCARACAELTRTATGRNRHRASCGHLAASARSASRTAAAPSGSPRSPRSSGSMPEVPARYCVT